MAARPSWNLQALSAVDRLHPWLAGGLYRTGPGPHNPKIDRWPEKLPRQWNHSHKARKKRNALIWKNSRFSKIFSRFS
jgi:hypothetical protein